MSNRERRRLNEYLEDVIGAIDRIYRYTSGLSLDVLLESELIQDATVRNFEIIGEALHQLIETYPDFYSRHPEIPFQNAYSMRNKLAHLYWKTEGEIIWETIQIDLPVLREKVQSAHRNL